MLASALFPMFASKVPSLCYRYFLLHSFLLLPSLALVSSSSMELPSSISITVHSHDDCYLKIEIFLFKNLNMFQIMFLFAFSRFLIIWSFLESTKIVGASTARIHHTFYCICCLKLLELATAAHMRCAPSSICFFSRRSKSWSSTLH